MRYDDIGNIHYGYVGRVLFYKQTLLVGAGIAQILDGNSSPEFKDSNYDDPRDQWAVEYGSILWDNGGV